MVKTKKKKALRDSMSLKKKEIPSPVNMDILEYL